MSDDQSNEPGYRMRPGLGVIPWRSRILVYQMDGERIVWARYLGAETAELSDELAVAIRGDAGRSE